MRDALLLVDVLDDFDHAPACPRIDEAAASVAVEHLSRIVGARVTERVPRAGVLSAPSARS